MNWISVKERLPENDGFAPTIIAYTRSGMVMPGWLEEKKRVWWLLDDADYPERFEFDRVTHWMPLPEPPKEEE